MKHNKSYFLYFLLFFFFSVLSSCDSNEKSSESSLEVGKGGDYVRVPLVEDFEFGKSVDSSWYSGQWINLVQRKSDWDSNFKTRVKFLYSLKGLYFLFEVEDEKITATFENDFDDLWKEDVVEVFLMPDSIYPVYFEYEISPLSKELPIIVYNKDFDLLRWKPFHYEKGRLTRKRVDVWKGVEKDRTNWRVQIFIPYDLLYPLNHIPPMSGDEWRVNFYRIDYDSGASVGWSWKKTHKNFHEYKSFGKALFL